MSNSKKIGVNFIPLISLLLIILNQILMYSVTPPASIGQPTRYIIYWILYIISLIYSQRYAKYPSKTCITRLMGILYF
ncbi:hypothetical protein, partial [Paucilactobacillus kaifaensis]|uniref:hypothetical protein n=1 Tax=Paucilactobacillus kaifaensis TaxID=2559921 RepID=UPI001CC51DF9